MAQPDGTLGVGGTLSWTLLALVVVPVVHTLTEDPRALAAWGLSRLRALAGTAGREREIAPPPP